MLLTTAILAPSVITLTNIDEKAFAIDFNEEEKKEEKKEAKEKDFFLETDLNLLGQLQREKKLISQFYIESNYSSSLAIFLPPPERSI